MWRIRDGDESGLETLMQRHKEAVFRFAVRYTRNETDAAELTEEVFYRVYMNADRFKPKAKVKTWIFTIAANLGRDFARRRARKPAFIPIDANADATTPGPGNQPPDNAPSPAGETESAETLNAIQAAVDALPHKLKVPFVFCVLEEHSYGECAAVLHTNRKAVETRIYRARRMLRDKLAAYRR